MGYELRKARKALGLTCLDVEKHSGISKSSVLNIEKAATNALAWNIHLLCKCYQVKIEDIIK